MIRLLSAGFKRLFKNKIFWTIIAVMCALSVFVNVQQYDNIKDGFDVDVANVMFIFMYFIPVGIAVLCSAYSGSEFSEGTIRNKIIIGHSRVSIYLTNLIFMTASALMFMIAYILPYTILGLIIFGKSEIALSSLLLNALLAVATITAFCSLYTMFTMLIAKKAAVGVVCLLVFMMGFMSAMTIDSKLDAPEYYQGYELKADGTVGMSEPTPNPRYLKGTKRAVYEAANDILPSCQSLQIIRYTASNPTKMIVSDITLLIAAAAIGAAAFKRKDLK